MRQAMGWEGGVRWLHRVMENELRLHVLPPPASCLPPAGGLTSYSSVTAKATRQPFSTSSHWQMTHSQGLCFPLALFKLACPPGQTLTLLPHQLPFHQLRSLPCALSLLLVTADWHWMSARLTPYSHLTLVPASPVPKANCGWRSLISSKLPACGFFFILCPFNLI